MTTIKAAYNQTMLDVIIQGTGSLEAAMQFCNDNSVSITDTPAVGTVYNLSAAAMALGDAGVLAYLTANDIIVGNQGAAPVVIVREMANEDGTIMTNEDGTPMIFE